MYMYMYIVVCLFCVLCVTALGFVLCCVANCLSSESQNYMCMYIHVHVHVDVHVVAVKDKEHSQSDLFIWL